MINGGQFPGFLRGRGRVVSARTTLVEREEGSLQPLLYLQCRFEFLVGVGNDNELECGSIDRLQRKKLGVANRVRDRANKYQVGDARTS